MEFHKKLKNRLYIAISYLILGAFLIVYDLITHPKNDFGLVFGIAMLIMGILRIFQYRRITSSDQSIKERQMVETDERNKMIAERARSWAFSLYFLLSGITVIILSFLGRHEIATPISYSVLLLVVFYWVSYLILRRKY